MGRQARRGVSAGGEHADVAQLARALCPPARRLVFAQDLLARVAGLATRRVRISTSCCSRNPERHPEWQEPRPSWTSTSWRHQAARRRGRLRAQCATCSVELWPRRRPRTSFVLQQDFTTDIQSNHPPPDECVCALTHGRACCPHAARGRCLHSRETSCVGCAEVTAYGASIAHERRL